MSAVVSDCFTIGSIVATRTCYNENIEGEVLAFDPQTKMLILKCQSSSGNPKRHDVNIVNLSLVSDVQIKKEVSTVPEPPQSLNLHRLNTRVRNSIENKRRLVSALSACLDPEGQRLFMAIARVIDDVSWAGQSIRVYNNKIHQVMITPPYKVDDVIGEKDSQSYNYIKKFVERHWRDRPTPAPQQ
ncbi:protein LSM12 homolog A [Bombyx mandarina]|uniref:AD domain-containing protein n=2 Tax=Bombyx TaxID=7090 RepID=A0A8R1WEE5_BOMMO|nr:LSM12 homolog A [Bombyx mori]XP_028031977.1 protein LSM12 homolog A [Bombyx mandarina]